MVAAIGVFLACYYLPVGEIRFDRAILEGFHMVRNYAQDHVLLCLVSAFFIAGAISVFVNQDLILKHLGAKAHKGLAYEVLLTPAIVIDGGVKISGQVPSKEEVEKLL